MSTGGGESTDMPDEVGRSRYMHHSNSIETAQSDKEAPACRTMATVIGFPWTRMADRLSAGLHRGIPVFLVLLLGQRTPESIGGASRWFRR